MIGEGEPTPARLGLALQTSGDGSHCCDVHPRIGIFSRGLQIFGRE